MRPYVPETAVSAPEDSSRMADGEAELMPVVVAVRVKPNPENAPTAVQTDSKNGSVTLQKNGETETWKVRLNR